MTFNGIGGGISARERIILLVLLLIGALYVFSIWEDTKNQNKNEVLQVAKSVEATLPKQELKNLEQDPEELKDNSYPVLKNALQNVIKVNPKARFAYLYVERNGKLYFLVDSEPESSPDYSPAGQEFTEADPVDMKPITEGIPLVTQPVTDRWGTWVSVEVPVRDTTGKVIAAYGMDYNANAWKSRLLFEVSESSLMVIVVLVLALVTRRSYRKNILLKKEIAQREIAEKNLKKNEQTLSNLVSHLPGMVYRCQLDEQYTMNYMSEACIEITGYSPEDFTANKTIAYNDLIFPEYRQKIWNNWQKTLVDNSIFEAEYPICTASGETKWVWERGRCIVDEEGTLQFLEGYIEDISDIKRNETELILAKEKAEESERLKSAFLANISHEIRTPMNGILGFAELLKEPDLSPENHQEFIATIEINLYRMLNIINDLIDISKIEAGEMVLKIRPTNINAMLRDLHLDYIPRINTNKIKVNYHCDLPDDESNIETDHLKLNQILTNLIKNAFKFTSEGSVSFGYKKTTLGLEFYVSDTGMGIQPDVKEMIFERFMQADLGSTRRFEGVGLGLTISKAYVEQLGGFIRVESEVGKGSTFLFELPYKASNTSLTL
ncbi:MAG TPA: ATP-binding protein [Prolixibacteraceae bacterium]|nr:ATP-binding protein [Prolixibacteraceae bacterium]